MFRTERFRRLSKEGFWVVLGQAMAVLGVLVGVRLLTELLDPAAYGELALGMTVATLVNQTVLGPLSNGVTRFYAPAQEQGDLGGYLNAVRRLVLSATGLIILMIQREIGESSWFGFSLVIRPGSKLTRKSLVVKLNELGFECRPIVAGNFAKKEVVKYFNSEVYGTLDNAEHIDRNGLFIGNHHFPIPEAFAALAKIS